MIVSILCHFYIISRKNSCSAELSIYKSYNLEARVGQKYPSMLVEVEYVCSFTVMSETGRPSPYRIKENITQIRLCVILQFFKAFFKK